MTSDFMGFLNKLKDTAEKGTELEIKCYDGTRDAAKKGHDTAKND